MRLFLRPPNAFLTAAGSPRRMSGAGSLGGCGIGLTHALAMDRLRARVSGA